MLFLGPRRRQRGQLKGLCEAWRDGVLPLQYTYRREAAAMMRTVILLTSFLYATASWADVETARSLFDQGDFKGAVAELLPLAQGGDVDAQYWLARSYDAMEQPGLAFEWFEKAAENDHADAQRVLGIYYDQGKTVAADSLAAACLYRDSAMRGNAKAQRYLGLMFADGVGVARDDEKAAYWLKRAAAGGNPDAQKNLAHLYYFGVGVDKDRAKAAELYATAANSGIPAAKADLGKLYYRGTGVKQDLAKARDLFSDAAAAGNISAQYYLGRMYAEGEGVERDAVEAYFWLTLAANAVRTQDDPDPDGWRAHERVTKLADELDQAAMETVQERVRNWRAK